MSHLVNSDERECDCAMCLAKDLLPNCGDWRDCDCETASGEN